MSSIFSCKINITLISTLIITYLLLAMGSWKFWGSLSSSISSDIKFDLSSSIVNLVWHCILVFHWRLLYDHRVLNSLILFFCFFLKLFAWWLSELSKLVPIHSLPLVRTSLHLDLRNLIKCLFLALADDKVVRNIPYHSFSHIFAEVVWRSPASKLSGL